MAKDNIFQRLTSFARLIPTDGRWSIFAILFSTITFFSALSISLYAVYVSLYAIYIASVGEPSMTPINPVNFNLILVGSITAIVLAGIVFIATIALIIFWLKHPYESTTSKALRYIVKGILDESILEDKKVDELAYVSWQAGKKLNKQYKLYNKSSYEETTKTKKNGKA